MENLFKKKNGEKLAYTDFHTQKWLRSTDNFFFSEIHTHEINDLEKRTTKENYKMLRK